MLSNLTTLALSQACVEGRTQEKGQEGRDRGEDVAQEEVWVHLLHGVDDDKAYVRQR